MMGAQGAYLCRALARTAQRVVGTGARELPGVPVQPSRARCLAGQALSATALKEAATDAAPCAAARAAGRSTSSSSRPITHPPSPPSPPPPPAKCRSRRLLCARRPRCKLGRRRRNAMSTLLTALCCYVRGAHADEGNNGSGGTLLQGLLVPLWSYQRHAFAARERSRALRRGHAGLAKHD